MTTDFGRKPTDEERDAKKKLEEAVEKTNAALPALRDAAKSWVAIPALNKDCPKGVKPIGWIGELKDGCLPPIGYEATNGGEVTTPGPCLGLPKPELEGCAIKVVKDW